MRLLAGYYKSLVIMISQNNNISTLEMWGKTIILRKCKISHLRPDHAGIEYNCSIDQLITGWYYLFKITKDILKCHFGISDD